MVKKDADISTSEPEAERLQIQNGGDPYPVYGENPDTRCGFGACRPEFMQVFASVGAFVGIYSMSGLLTSSLSVYVNSQISMLEKQFGFSSAESGVLMSCNDIGYLTCALFAGYLASKCHIPIVLALSTIMFGICGLMCALPYFLQDSSAYDVNYIGVNVSSTGRQKVPMCESLNGSIGDSSCSGVDIEETAFNLEELRVKRVAYWLIAIGMVFQGVGKSVRNPGVTLYIDDAADKKNTGFYIGIVIALSILGPALAFILGGVFNTIYVTLQPVDISPKDPRWIGAWWLGFLCFGIASIVMGVPVMCFPRKLRSRSRRLEEDRSAVSSNDGKKGDSVMLSLLCEIKGFVSAMIRVLTNPVFTLIVVSTCINLIGVSGILAFLPKFFASQYSLPLWKANITLALCAISAISIGTFVGGIITRKVDMNPITSCKVIILFFVIHIVCQAAGIFLGCDQPALVGDNVNRTRPDLYSPTNTSCLHGCACNDEKYFPICGDDGVTYFSPCHAGCTEKQGGMGFENCTCIPNGQARAGLCDQDCSPSLEIYAIVTFIGRFVTALKIMPTFIAKIRCVEEQDRAVALATYSFLSSVIGWMPGPVIFGMIIDKTCLLWNYTCGERQSCQLYDINYFRNAIHAYGVVASLVAMLFIVILYIYFRVKGIRTWKSESPDRKKRRQQ